MSLDYDVHHLPGGLRDWARLIEALGKATDDTVEKSYLELKGPLDLTTAEHKFALAKAVLAFANRDTAAAAPFFDGRALIVVGVGKGAVTGIRRIEDHQLLAALRPYLGDDDDCPRWKAERQRVDDVNDVLIIVVDAPRPGDPLFTLRQKYGNHLGGTVFSRPSTESVQANPAGIRMLSRRLLARQEDFAVEVSLGNEDIHRYTWDPNVLEPFLAAVKQNYRDQVPKSDPAPRTPQDAFTRLKLPMPRVEPPSWARTERRHEEDRTEAEFLAQVETWAERCRSALPDVVLDLLAATLSPARFTIENLRGRFLEDVEVEVHLAGPVIQHPKPFSRTSALDRLPNPPRRWGPWTEKLMDYSNFASVKPSDYRRPARPNTTTFRNSGSVTAVLRCKELRPWTSHTFTDGDDHQDIVLLTPDLDLAVVNITTTATARGINGNCVVETTHPVAPQADATETIRVLLDRLRAAYTEAKS